MGNTSSTIIINDEERTYVEVFKEWLETQYRNEEDDFNKPYNYATVLQVIDWEDEANEIEINLNTYEIDAWSFNWVRNDTSNKVSDKEKSIQTRLLLYKWFAMHIGKVNKDEIIVLKTKLFRVKEKLTKWNELIEVKKN